MFPGVRPTALGPLLAVFLVLGTEAFALAQSAPCPTPGTRPASEACLRTELGVPRDAKRVVIVSSSSHLDWDWRHTFDEYFQGPLTDPVLIFRPGTVETIFSDALGLMAASHRSGAPYYYAVAEMGFLQRFVEAKPDRLDALRAVGQDLRIVGGGVTSPDSLLPVGEAFIRDYLVGKTWVDATLGLPIRQAWVPDDFGHDAQLPIVLEAMGFEGVGFGRVPGVAGSLQSIGLVPPDPGSVAADLLQNGSDFVWRAADASSVVAHWMPGGYCQGDFRLPDGTDQGALDALERLIAADPNASNTGYMLIPVGCDFSRPRSDLLELVAAWNANAYARTGVWAVVATFDHYVQLLAAHRAALPDRRFDPSPYWTGFYATRPLLKTMHLRATYALLAAETFGVLADGGRRDTATWRARVAARTAAIHAGWATLVPSNHHDFITGTALDAVYENEQLPRLANAVATGEAERTRALDEIVAAVRRRPGDGPTTVVVFNPLGFARRGLVEAPGAPVRRDEQASVEGGRLFFARVPSLGYATADLARTGTETVGRASLTMQPDGSSVVFENRYLRATLSRDSGWGIVSLIDQHTGGEMIRAGEVGNALVPYADDGGLYRFGSEMKGCRLVPQPGTVVGGAGSVLEAGPLRVRFVADVVVDGRPFHKEYRLVAGEPYLRMLSTGSAAAGTSVMVHFPLSGPIDRLIHGTPYHWDEKQPERAGELTFEATHDFLVPGFQGRARGAIFHAGAPAWAVRRDGMVVGALWRNAPRERCDLSYGAEGTDPHEAALAYALRVPTGIRSARSGKQLREALDFHEPLLAVAGRSSGHLPRIASLARATPSSAIITAAKAGTTDPSALVLRVYQPTNRPLRVAVRTQVADRFPPHRRLGLKAMTALEVPLSRRRAARLDLEGSASRFSFVATGALTTIAVRDRAR